MNYLLKCKKVIIYGAGDVGKRLYDLMENNGITVAFFIDKRASVYKDYQGKKVYVPESLQSLDSKSEYCILIAFKNVFQHEQVARNLQRQGFKNIIYQPYSVLLNQCDNYCLNAIASIHTILADDEVFYDDVIPVIEDKLVFQLKECKTIDRKNGMKLLYIPSELLFENKDKLGSSVDELCMVSTYPSVSLFESFQMGEVGKNQDSVRFFIDVIAKPTAERNKINTDEKWEYNVIEGRKAVYDEMNKRYSMDFSFFENYSTEVKYNENNKFIISSSGKNRISFLIAKGNRFIPVMMSQNDFEAFVNKQVFDEIADRILDKKIFAPVLHPYFYYFPVVAEDYGFKWLKRIGNYISRLGFQEKNHFGLDKYQVAILMSDQGTTYRFLKRMNLLTQVTFVSNEDRECAELISRLENMECYMDEVKKKEDVDFLCIDSKCKHLLNENIYEVYKMVFAQVWNDDMELIELFQEKGFYVKELFFTSLWDGTYVKGFCMEREKEKMYG